MKIENSNGSDTTKTVSFERTLPSGRKRTQYIEALTSPFIDEKPSINFSGANLQLEDVPEFIKAIKLAAMIASGELKINLKSIGDKKRD